LPRSKPMATRTAETDFVSLTEVSGDDVSTEQVERMARRYYWAGDYCRDKDVLEVACGTGQGVGYLASIGRSVTAGDYSKPVLEIARRHYGRRFEFRQFDAQQMPFADNSFDVVLIFEALYYLPDHERFFQECRRVLRPNGVLLIATANKDLFDFNPSPHSTRYFGVAEFSEILGRFDFVPVFFGDTPVNAVSARQRLLRPVKAMASRLGLIPKSMSAKKLLKRLAFGGLVQMPPEVTEHTAPRVKPTALPAGRPDRSHKVLYCAATLHR
jgi:SAM-dependent methyltransferase